MTLFGVVVPPWRMLFDVVCSVTVNVDVRLAAGVADPTAPAATAVTRTATPLRANSQSVLIPQPPDPCGSLRTLRSWCPPEIGWPESAPARVVGATLPAREAATQASHASRGVSALGRRKRCAHRPRWWSLGVFALCAYVLHGLIIFGRDVRASEQS